jgi:hypothetical protein
MNFLKYIIGYLLTFTFTQLIDFMLWIEEGRVGLAQCSSTNLGISKYVIPMVVFSQHCVQCYYPSKKLEKYRTFIAFLHLLPILGMMYQFGCSTIVNTIHGPSLCWGSVIAEMYQILIHSGIVAFVFLLLMPLRVALLHVAVLAFVMTLLYSTEGTLALGSKWCSYCLVYSIMYILDPYWAPAPKGKTK